MVQGGRTTRPAVPAQSSARVNPLISATTVPSDHASGGSHDGGYDERYVPALAAAEDRHFWFRGRNAVIRAVAARLEATLPDRYRILEVGCGTGNTLRVLDDVFRRGSVLGMDWQHQGLAIARRRVACPVVQADLRQAPFPPDLAFDVVGMFDVLEHLADDAAALSAIRERLTPGGLLLLTVPAAPELWSAFDVAARHCRRYTAETLQRALIAARFDLHYVSPFMTALYPMAWLKRRWSPRRRRHVDPVLDDLRIVPGLNGALARLLGWEAGHIAAGRRLPLGTSLIAIAGRPPASTRPGSRGVRLDTSAPAE